MTIDTHWQRPGLLLSLLLCILSTGSQVAADTPSMLQALPDSGFQVRVLLTVGDVIGEYQPPGRIDGLAAWPLDAGRLRILANHELPARGAYAYTLANGLRLRGSRISFFDLDTDSGEIVAAGLAYDRLRDRRGAEVTAARQVSERDDAPQAGLNTLCSAAGYAAGQYGFVDDLFLTNEEVSAREDHPHGGSIWALDVRGRELWAAPDLGRGSWENVTALSMPEPYVALLLGDDVEFGRAPLYLYLGRREPGGDFLARNGLRGGQLHVWVAETGERTPADWRGTGSSRSGRFAPVAVRDPARAGKAGYDRRGYLDDTTLRDAAWQLGAFAFSRPEDLHTNPADGLQVVFASTGHGDVFPEDDWGSLYRIEVQVADAAGQWPGLTATLRLIHDADDFGDAAIRNPDNLTWASDGMVYVQEDKATKRGRFGAASGIEASLWRIDPERPQDRQRLAVIDRDVLLPDGVRDLKAGVPGAWESSGIVDVSGQLGLPPERLALLLSVQAHGVRNGPVGGARDLVEGGQLLLLTR